METKPVVPFEVYYLLNIDLDGPIFILVQGLEGTCIKKQNNETLKERQRALKKL